MANVKFKIKGNKKIPNFDSELEIEVDDKYEAYSKAIPEERTPYRDAFITWFNAYGVREKSNGKDADVTYTVTLQALPPNKQLFALYGGEPHEIIVEEAGRGRVKFTLNVGDPPTGISP